MKHRKPIKNWFITFPQTEITKEEFVKKIQKLNFKKIQVSQETHKDGGKHLHSIIELKIKKNKKYILDILKSIFPQSWKRIHIGSIRSLEDSSEYIRKEDKNVLEQKLPTQFYIEFMKSYCPDHYLAIDHLLEDYLTIFKEDDITKCPICNQKIIKSNTLFSDKKTSHNNI